MYVSRIYPIDILNNRNPVVSQDPSNYADAPTEGIRRVLEIVTGESIPRKTVLNTDKIGSYEELSIITKN